MRMPKIKTRVLLLVGIAAIGLALIGQGCSSDQGPLVLVDNGKANCTIVIPDDADSFTHMAAGWLVDYVKRATGAELSVVEESGAPSGTLISVGHTKLAAKAGIDAEGLKLDGSRMAVRGRVLYLLGRDSALRDGAIPSPKEGPWLYYFENSTAAEDLGTGPKGTCKAVTSFLEDFCGIRWLAPTPKGVVVPKAQRIEVPAELDRRISTPFAFWQPHFYGSQMSRPAAYANNVRCAVRMRTYGGHSYIHWFPPSLFKDHPEYFVMYNGQRTSVGHHLCASNPEVRKILLRGMQEVFDSGYDWLELGQSDGHTPCECDACEKMDPDSNRRALLLHQWLCEQLAKSHPDKTVMLLIYGPTRQAYEDIKFGKNVVLEITTGHPRQLEEWKGQGRPFTVYPYWMAGSLGMGYGPRMGPADAAQIMRLYHEKGVVGMFVWGSGWSWGLMGPTYYVLGKMMGDPSLDDKQLVKEYCAGLYGAAGDEMDEFFTTLYSRSYWRIRFQGEVRMSISESIKYLYPPAFIQGLEERLARAEEVADSEHARKWIQMTRDEFDYIKHMSNMLTMYDAYLVNRSPDLFAQLKSSVESFRAFRRRIVALEGDRVADYFPGHNYFAKFLTTGANSGSYSAWWGDQRKETDYDLLDRSGVGYPSGSSLSMPINLDFDAAKDTLEFRLTRTSNRPVVDGKLDDASWRQAKPVRLKGSVATRIRGLYDQENLYISYECEETDIDKMNVKDLYRDGEVSLLDCIEFLVAPDSPVYATRYYHFLMAPAKDALLDLRTGWNSTAWGSPAYQDDTWNAEGLKFAYTIDKQAGKWIIEMMIPLKDIEVSMPEPGTVWMGNLGRERYANGMELQLWSQGGENGFTDPRAFGKFIFE